MKNRTQSFHCAIADKAVEISLRHGGGFREPANVYVRCEERDCQYVDLNTPPCPLRIEMFAERSDRQVAEHLRTHAGKRVCYSCLAETLSMSHDQVRRATWRIKDDPGVSIRPTRCSTCRSRRVTIGLKLGVAEASAPLLPLAPDPPLLALAPEVLAQPDGTEELATLLRSQPGFSFCVHCLTRELRSRPSVVREAMWALEGQPGFGIRTAQCVSCLLSKPVIRYEESSEVAAPRRLLEFLFQAPGTAFCHACVAFSTDLALSDVRRILQSLEPVAEIERRTAVCEACGRWQPTVGLRVAAANAQQVDELGDVLSGFVRYRGFRIDLLSFRATDGWRPFALVKSGKGVLVPSVPPIVLGLLPTKLEADERAAATAREWIDKRVP